MAMSLNDFLQKYYMQLHFDRMPEEVRARFDDYAKRGDFKGNMKKWKDELDGKSLPDPNDPNDGLGQDDWEKLFNIFNSTLGRMKRDADGLANNSQAKSFVDEYYGLHKLFSIEPVTDAAALTEIDKIKQNIHLLRSFLPDDVSFDKFRQELTNNKYDSDEKFRDTFINFVEKLERAKNWGIQSGAARQLVEQLDTEAILRGFEQKPAPGKLASFKREYKSILDSLHDKTKLREMFGNNDEGKISGQIAKALKKVNYDDKSADNKSYVHPKVEDELTLFQQVKKWVGDTYENHLEKYAKLRGDRMFFSEPAKMICKAIDSAKIKPTEGIAAVLNKAEEIKKGLQYKSPTAVDHFDWFVKEMNVLKSEMPKAFEGALKNGPQLRHLIEKLIVDAIEQNKIKEAKTAMEVLSVIKYANTTSAIMDQIKSDKDLFTIFSNDKLSWNKNDGVRFVTSALDKSVRAAFIGIGYGVTMAINGVRKSRSKIRTPGKLISKAHEDWRADTARERTETEQINQNATNRKAQYLTVVQGSRRKSAIDNEINVANTQLQQNQTAIVNGLQALDQFITQQTNGQPTQDPDIQAVIKYIEDTQKYMQDRLNPPAQGNPSPMPTMPMFTTPRFVNATDPDVMAAIQSMNAIGGNLGLWSTNSGILTARQQELQNLLDARSQLIAAHNQMKETEAKLGSWDDDHKDKYDELINFWNRLETGRDSHMGEMYSWRLGSAKKKQEEFWRQNGGRGM